MTTHLKLEQYFFPHIQVSADASCPNPEKLNEIKYEINVGLGENKKEKKYQVTLDISSYPEDEEHPQPYSIHLIAVGIFKVEDWPEPEKLLLINGASILYSSAREFLITTSGRGPWGALTLPVYSFLDHFNRKVANAKKDVKTAS